MKKIVIYDPKDDQIGSYRGGGRIIQILKENLPKTDFASDLSKIHHDDILLIPHFNLFSPPITNKRLTNNQFLIIFDVIPLKYSEHFPAGLRGNFNLWRNKRALNNFDKIITISESSKKDIIRYLQVPEEKIEVIYPCLSQIFIDKKNEVGSEKLDNEVRSEKIENRKIKNISLQRNEATNPASHFSHLTSSYCIYVGDVNWNKNLVNLAKAIKIADIPCVFVGKVFNTLTEGDNKIFAASQLSEQASPDGALAHARSHKGRAFPSNGMRVDLARKSLLSTLDHPWQLEFKQFLEEVGDDPRFIFLGYVEDSELVELYRDALCNILVSRDEGFGLSYLEASSQKCPSVLSDIPIFREIAATSALFCNHLSPASISENILKFLNSDLRRKIGENAYNYIQKYSPIIFRSNLMNQFR
ncbi:hypothetical protein A3C23_04710 [Candidatus Roizmanbacteria bacterium RIFCSPHIGHO2_02_FULL_37_13b]|uniref:Glycosyl transferase family 1 domain-containing protein n=1 Tax=Candidatus Roizmanbacteria bacterium RIFCSPLOWO2_02_FULL_36_11 TaxID=1802071 RepID=A0A1F7JHC9_9BACT|nr:MAG: hypothetical protein A3C23_04710 [Candidatus Roizmanbacteria bacterium RIFCSPHIGHO2_02_FULL_37_13b]OGK55009.1 MAG: hypothetical protein A3H78_00855 [Candidatus Roizmanbacteria bacterium RIFCSPLOWO2_02_FULL_36_11]